MLKDQWCVLEKHKTRDRESFRINAHSSVPSFFFLFFLFFLFFFLRSSGGGRVHLHCASAPGRPQHGLRPPGNDRNNGISAMFGGTGKGWSFVLRLHQSAASSASHHIIANKKDNCRLVVIRASVSARMFFFVCLFVCLFLHMFFFHNYSFDYFLCFFFYFFVISFFLPHVGTLPSLPMPECHFLIFRNTRNTRPQRPSETPDENRPSLRTAVGSVSPMRFVCIKPKGG
jgi:hypothetical protein